MKSQADISNIINYIIQYLKNNKKVYFLAIILVPQKVIALT